MTTLYRLRLVPAPDETASPDVAWFADMPGLVERLGRLGGAHSPRTGRNVAIDVIVSGRDDSDRADAAFKIAVMYRYQSFSFDTIGDIASSEVGEDRVDEYLVIPITAREAARWEKEQREKCSKMLEEALGYLVNQPPCYEFKTVGEIFPPYWRDVARYFKLAEIPFNAGELYKKLGSVKSPAKTAAARAVAESNIGKYKIGVECTCGREDGTHSAKCRVYLTNKQRERRERLRKQGR